MSHHHGHDHHHHHHDHDHDHHHDEEPRNALSFDEKLVKLLEHWVKHNDDHAENYKSWAQRARSQDMEEVASLLEAAADMTMIISKKFEAAAEIAKKK
jgi:hypothetical protein